MRQKDRFARLLYACFSKIFLAKNFIDISDTLINDADLSKLDLYILGPGYLKERIFCFTKVITKDKVQGTAEEPKVSDSKEKKKSRATLQKEKRDTLAVAYLFADRFCRFSAIGPVSGLSSLYASALSGSARSTMLVLCSSAPYASAGSA